MADGREGWHKGVEIKSARELGLMRMAGRIAALALAEMRDRLKPGVSGKQLDAIAEKVIARHKAAPAFKGVPGPYPYPFATTISINEQLVHGLPTGRLIREGDLVSLDCGVLHQGFYADNAITVGVGRVSGEAAQLLAVTEQALYKGIAQARVGRRVGDISHAIQQFVEGQGYHLAREYTGHGVGRHMHEDPEVPNQGKPGSGRLLRPGLVLAIEPMVMIGTTETLTQPDGWTAVSEDGSLACHFEHTVAVTDSEPEILTTI
jgi:methionyl aminopeptidase